MLLEQSFYALPEILNGSGYQLQSYEAGIVNAFTLATLQVLNGRNIRNPIGCIQIEKAYRNGGVYAGLVTRRFLRADFYLNISKSMSANKKLRQYGWRHEFWMEAKFFRGEASKIGKDKKSKFCSSRNKTIHSCNILADLIRLCTLVPENANSVSSTGRYLLHAYDANPKYYLTEKREWTQTLYSAGSHTISLSGLDKEAAVVNLLGNLGALDLRIDITNFLAEPVTQENLPVYWCYLTRIDSFDIKLGDINVSLKKDGTVETASQDSIDKIAEHVVSLLHVKKDSTDTKPDEAENSEPDVEQDDNGS